MEKPIHLKFSRQQLYCIAAIIFLSNLFFLLATYLLYYFFYQLPHNPAIVLNLSYFNLAEENTFGTCYSAWLLLSVAIVAAFCFIADKQKNNHHPSQILSYGWLFISGIFGLLSLDEVGSFHERLGNSATFHLFGEWADYIIFHSALGAVAVFMLFFCWKRLRTNIWASALLITGLLLFVSLRFQENFEIANYSLKRPVYFILIEEGTEIFGSFCFLIAMTLSLIYLLKKEINSSGNILIDLPIKLKPQLAMAGTMAFIFLLALSQLFLKEYFKHFAQADKGIPENWFPGATAFLGAVILLSIYYNKTKLTAPRPVLYLLTGIFCLVLSLIYGSNFYFTYIFYEVGWYPLVLKILMGGGALRLGVGLMQQLKTFWNWAGVLIWIMLFCLSLLLEEDYYVNGNYFARIGFIAFGGLLVALISHVYLWQKEEIEEKPLVNLYPVIPCKTLRNK